MIVEKFGKANKKKSRERRERNTENNEILVQDSMIYEYTKGMYL